MNRQPLKEVLENNNRGSTKLIILAAIAESSGNCSGHKIDIQDKWKIQTKQKEIEHVFYSPATERAAFCAFEMTIISNGLISDDWPPVTLSPDSPFT